MKKTKKLIMGSALAIGFCASLMAGTTYALFTSESAVGIEITTGNVQVTADVVADSVKTGYESDRTELLSGPNTSLVATYDSNSKLVSIDNMVPGDIVTFNVSVANHSSIDYKYRLRFGAENGYSALYNDLLIGIRTADDAEGVTYYDYNYYTSYVTEWKNGQGNDGMTSVEQVIIMYPAYVTKQLAEKENSCRLAFSVEAVQGNAVKDNDLTAQRAYLVRNQTELSDAVNNKMSSGDTVVLMGGESPWTNVEINTVKELGMTVKGYGVENMTIDAENSDIDYYNNTSKLNVNAVKDNSLHVFGRVDGEMNVTKGRAVVEETAFVQKVVVLSDNASIEKKGEVNSIDFAEGVSSAQFTNHINSAAELKAMLEMSCNKMSLVLESDITITEPMYITEGKSADLHLNGKTVNYVASVNTRPFMVNTGAALTVYGEEGSILCAQENVYGIFDNSGTLEIYGGHYETNGANGGAVVRGRSGGKIHIYSGEFICKGYDAALYDDGDCIIEDGYFYTDSSNRTSNWNYCLQNASGTMHIKNATVRGIQGGIFAGGTEMIIDNCDSEVGDHLGTEDWRSFYALYVNGNHEEAHCVVKGGTFKSAYRSAAYSNNTTPGDGGECLYEKLEIHGGTFIGGANASDKNYALYVGNPDGDVVITGGTFNSNVSKWVADGYATIKNKGDGSLFTVVPETIELTEDVLCPDCYNGKGEHEQHPAYAVFADGAASFTRAGAWMAFGVTLDTAKYVLTVDYDLAQLGEGSFIAFDCGETKSWQDLHLGFSKKDGKYFAYNTLFADKIDAVNSVELSSATVKATYTFELIDGKISMTLALDGVEFASRTGIDFTGWDSNVNCLCWNVYTYEAANDEQSLCSVTDIRFSKVSV